MGSVVEGIWGFYGLVVDLGFLCVSWVCGLIGIRLQLYK
jgi:hypothetical protein